jgi:transketolase
MTTKQKILQISYELGLSHLGSNLSCADLLDEIYKNMDTQDKVVLDNGHAHLAHAVVMEKFGLIKSAKQNIKKYGIHCDRRGGCDVSTGSLGQGITVAVGLALADRSRTVYCLCSEGSSAEGSFWEALRIAGEQKLDNLRLIFNANGFNALTEVPRDPIIARINAFGWAVIKVTKEKSSFAKVPFKDALKLGKLNNIPLCIFCETNNGLPILDSVEGHYKVLSKADYQNAAKIL